MEGYVRSFELNTVETYLAEDVGKCAELLKTDSLQFSLLHQNIRSLNKHIDELEIIIERLNQNFHCIILSETWDLPDVSILQIGGYHLLYNCGDINQNDGLVVYIRDDLDYAFEIIHLGSVKVLQVTVKFYNKEIIVTGIYKPPSVSSADFNENMSKYLSNCPRNKDLHILAGDVNINILDSDEISEEYLNILNTEGFVSTINNYTRIQNESRSCIDHIFLQDKKGSVSTINPIILETDITDHSATILQLLFEMQSDKNKTVSVSKDVLNYEKLNSSLASETWLEIYSENDVGLAVDKFLTKLEKYIGENTGLVKYKQTKKSPWITNGLIKSISMKNKLYRSAKNNPTLDNMGNYKRHRNLLNTLIRAAKKDYYQNQILSGNDRSSKKIWECVNKICKKGGTQNVHQIRTQAGIVLSQERTIADTFLNYFTNIGKTLADQIAHCCADGSPALAEKKNCKSIYIELTDENEVMKYMLGLKDRRTPGVDKLKSETIKQISRFICKPLTYIFNKSIETGTFPVQFKQTIIVPIYKSGDRMCLQNYRPISLITNFAKIFEKILCQRLTSFFNKTDVLSSEQYGFREDRSTNDAILDLTTNIYKALDAKNPSLAVFVDLSKAFDTVSHNQLLHMLERLGVRGVSHKLLASYLSQRSQYVRIGNSASRSSEIQYGVPQGTVLGPLLFNVYIHDMFHLDTKAKITTYADDTALFFTSDNWQSLKDIVQAELLKFFHYFKKKLLTVNIEKTCFVPFVSLASNLPSFSFLNIAGCCDCKEVEIGAENKIKYLGVYIDSHMRWNEHIKYVTNKVRSMLCKFKYFRSILTRSQMRILYHGLVEPHLAYGIAAWGGATNNHLTCLEVVQKWVLKLIHHKPKTYPTETLFNETGIFDIRQLFCIYVLTSQYKLKKVDHNIHTYLIRNKSVYSSAPKVDKTVTQRSFYYLGPLLYRKLPIDIQNLNSLVHFKNKVKKWLKLKPRLEIHSFIDLKNLYYIPT